MSQGKPRTVREALSPHSPLRKRPKSRITLATCPICRRSMSLVVLDTHIDRCKPPRARPQPSQSVDHSQQSTQIPPNPSQQPQTQAYIGSQPPPPDEHIRTIHFCLRRDDAGHPVCSAQFHPCEQCDDKTRAAFGAIVSLRGYIPSQSSPHLTRTHLYLHACSSTTSTNPPQTIPSLPSGSPAARLPLSILKSALQKCVRRRLSQPAVRVAVALLRKTRSPFELLRRLSIIVLEDAVLHPTYPTLVWLLAASSKGYAPSFADIRTIVTVVHELAASRVRDVGTAPSDDNDYNGPTNNTTTVLTAKATGDDDRTSGHTGGHGYHGTDDGDEGESHSQDACWQSLVESLRIRACYGGMSFDQSLLRRAIFVWHARFADKTAAWGHLLSRIFNDTGGDRITNEGLRLLLREDEPVLRLGDIPPAAWDFHCCAVSDDVSRELLGRGGPVIERFPRGFDDVKRGVEHLMWTYRSGINVKKPWSTFGEASLALKHSCSSNVEAKQSDDEILWRTEIEPSVIVWCRNYRRRYGL